jgi:hypothetical protein
MRSITLLAALMGLIFTASASAARPVPVNAIDADGDGSYVVPDLNNDGVVDDKDYAIAGPGATDKVSFEAIYGEIDCDDADPKRHPGAEEIFNDGIDQNCDDADFLPPTGWNVDNFTALAQHTCAGGDFHRAAKLVATCTAHVDCDFEVDTLGVKTGRLVMSNDSVMADFFKGTTLGGTTGVEFSDLTPGADGHCEGYTAEQYAYAVKSASPARRSGPSGTWVKSQIAAAQETQAEVDAEQDVRMDDLEIVVDANSLAIDNHAGAIRTLTDYTVESVESLSGSVDGLNTRLDDLEESDADQDRRIGELRRDVNGLETDVADNSATGVYFGASAGIGFGAQKAVADQGETVRASSTIGFRPSLSVGFIDSRRYMVGATGHLMLGSDQGPGPMHDFGLRIESLFRLGNAPAFVGPTVGISRHTTGSGGQLEAAIVDDRIGFGLGSQILLASGQNVHLALTPFLSLGPGFAHWETLPGFSGSVAPYFMGGVGISGLFSSARF